MARSTKAIPKTAPRPGRRFPKFPLKTRNLYLQKLNEDGLTRTEAAKAIGIDRKTIWQYRIAHPEFDEQVFKAERGAIEAIEDALYQKAKSGHFQAIEYVLNNRSSDRWGKARVVEAQNKDEATWESVKAAIVKALLEHPEAINDVVLALETPAR